MANGKINTKQLLFCKEYLVDLNATQAAIRAGYSKKTADVQGARLLVNVKVQQKINELMNQRSQKTEITAERVLEEIAGVAFSDIAEFYNEDGTIKTLSKIKNSKIINELTCITDKSGKVTRKLKVYDKLKALEMLGRHLVLFTDKLQHEGEVDVNQTVTVLNINHRKKGEKIEKQKTKKKKK